MARELLRAIGRRWPTLLAAGCLLAASAGTASASQLPREFPWTCAQTNGRIIMLSLDSTVYGRPVAVNVYLPPCYGQMPAPLPVIYLLHGANTDETQWPDVGVASAADGLLAQGEPAFVVVMPAGAYQTGVDYESFVLKDLMPGIEGRLGVSQEGTGRAIGGISLGGYWALKTAFEHPDLFAAAGGHSPVTTRTGGSDDPAALAGNAAGLEQLQITLDVGDLDSLRTPTEQMAGTLRARGLAVTLSVNSGGHNRPYWRLHTADYLSFYVKALTAHAQTNPSDCSRLQRRLSFSQPTRNGPKHGM